MTPLSRFARVLLLLLCTCLSVAASVLAPDGRPDLAALGLALAGGFAAALLRELSRDNGYERPPPPPPGNPKHWPDMPGPPPPPRAYWGNDEPPGDSTPTVPLR